MGKRSNNNIKKGKKKKRSQRSKAGQRIRIELPNFENVSQSALDSVMKTISLYKDIPEFEIDTGLEPEVVEEENTVEEISKSKFSALKYDPSTIRVAFRQFPIDLLLQRISEGAVNFNPGFQRAASIWNLKAKSRLIESLLINIPLPVFYLDSSDENKWDVIDGVQRLTAFKEFAVDKKLRLKGLEFMPELDGKGYEDLPRNLQRRFMESSVSLYLIEKGTPNLVKQSIYERINTGGTTLVQQEIRHAIFQGPAADLLGEMVALESFKTATGGKIKSLRMADRECALRFAAFFLNSYKDYQARDMDKFLSDTMERLSTSPTYELDEVKNKFDKSMKICSNIFGGMAFRKPIEKAKINKALFETWSSTLAKISESDAREIVKKKNLVKSRFIKLMRDPDFVSAISTGTGDVKRVHKRFEAVEAIVKGATQ